VEKCDEYAIIRKKIKKSPHKLTKRAKNMKTQKPLDAFLKNKFPLERPGRFSRKKKECAVSRYARERTLPLPY
jgi:hypothetical protein